LSSLRRQSAWAVIDQVLSSGTNFVPALLVARVLGPADYGAFSIVFVAWFGALQIVRSALMIPYTLAAAHLDTDDWHDVTKRAAGAVFLAGVVCGVVFAIAGAVIGVSSHLGESLLVIAVLAPALALQEFWRVASFAASRAKTAAANDGYWAIGQIVAFSILLVSTDHVSAAQCIFAWGAAAVFAAAVGIRQLSLVPSVNMTAVRWAREWSGIGAWLTADSATFSVGFFGVTLIVAAKIGNAGLGLFRVVQNLFGPIQLITTGGGSAFMPYLVRTIKKTQSNGLGPSWRFSALMTGSVIVYGLALLVAAHTVLTKAFGSDYAGASALVLPFLIAYAFDAVGSGAQMLLRARTLVRRVLVAQAAATVTKLAGVIILATVAGLRGAAWGFAIGSAVGAITFWAQVVLAGDRDLEHLRVGVTEGAPQGATT
jgi:O-antigen/teichoic acid export membrane protein